MRQLKVLLKELLMYKSALVGITIIASLIILSLYAVITAPYGEVTRKWSSIDPWEDFPKNAMPSWVNIFIGRKLPETIVLDSRKVEPSTNKTIIPITGGKYILRILFTFGYTYDDFPSEVILRIFSSTTKQFTAQIVWVKPGGIEYIVSRKLLRGYEAYYITSDEEFLKKFNANLINKLGSRPNYDISINEALFAEEDQSILNQNTVTVLKGEYRAIVDVLIGEEDLNKVQIDAKLVVYGKVHGIAGTDHRRRDLALALLWGTPIALAFGLVASITITFAQMFIAAMSAWYGKSFDFIVQRITEIFMVLPFLPMLLMISYFYKITIWVLLLIVILLSIFGSGVKNYRAMFLQIKEIPYIEAAIAYGTSSFRIVFRYMIPKILPTIIPSIVLSVPDFVFLEAALALFGVGDPQAVTWGRVLEDAAREAALYKGYYYWILQPSLLLLLTALGFAMLGLALDKIFNPRLREM
ncbi:MAG: ABC transporter permease [Ignisphaera sp.]|nr:ABC transporter permease [Ignisphaera sp.]MCX8167834.1 ABC transporter permease [Ignisphaera sp.]MDW8085801.1 ABC transporter permease [Ignisphaera sp.]